MELFDNDPKLEEARTSNELLAVANYIRSRGRGDPPSIKRMGKFALGYEVYLPGDADSNDFLLAAWLLEHPHEKVTLMFNRNQIYPENGKG